MGFVFRPKAGFALGLVCFLLIAGLASQAQAGRLKEASERHKRQCKEWCAQNEECGKCMPLLPCPPGTKKLKSWTGFGKNWYACSKPGHRRRAGQEHLEDCEKWCKANPDCGKCMPALPCPPGTTKLKGWTGYGKNWYACSKPGHRRRAGQEHREDCEKWCKANPDCGKCLPALPCPPGTTKLKGWTGYGKNWYACSKPGRGIL